MNLYDVIVLVFDYLAKTLGYGYRSQRPRDRPAARENPRNVRAQEPRAGQRVARVIPRCRHLSDHHVWGVVRCDTVLDGYGYCTVHGVDTGGGSVPAWDRLDP